jgi:hypothetical protein
VEEASEIQVVYWEEYSAIVFNPENYILLCFKTSSMTLRTVKGIVMISIFSTGLMVLSCKGKDKDKNLDTTTNADTITTVDTSTVVTTPPETVTEAQLKDATKDFPGVTATVNNGEVTLTGTIKRDDLPRLMQSVQALNPKKVNNNLTIQ